MNTLPDTPRGIQYWGFWMGFIAGTSYAPCDEHGQELARDADTLRDKLVFRTDLWFKTTTSYRRIIRAVLDSIPLKLPLTEGGVRGDFDFENSREIFVPVDRVAVLGENDQLTPLETLVDRTVALHAAIIQASHLTDS